MGDLARRVRGALGRGGDAALAALLAVYESRPDLQEVFPEARGGDYARLVDWAAHVTGEHWRDSARSFLSSHAAWYEANFTGTPPPLPAIAWEAVAAASATTGNPLAATLCAMRLPPRDIAEHLATLSLLVTEFRLKNVVELGVRTGVSTLALLDAAHLIEGRVLSVDVEPCENAYQITCRSNPSGTNQQGLLLNPSGCPGPPYTPASGSGRP